VKYGGRRRPGTGSRASVVVAVPRGACGRWGWCGREYVSSLPLSVWAFWREGLEVLRFNFQGRPVTLPSLPLFPPGSFAPSFNPFDPIFFLLFLRDLEFGEMKSSSLSILHVNNNSPCGLRYFGRGPCRPDKRCHRPGRISKSVCFLF
jgi:hypothetical protein